MCSLSREQSMLSREAIQNAIIFRNCAPFSTKTFYPLSSTSCGALVLIIEFFNLTLCHGKIGISRKIAIFTNLSFSFCQNFMKLLGYIVLLCALVFF